MAPRKVFNSSLRNKTSKTTGWYHGGYSHLYFFLFTVYRHGFPHQKITHLNYKDSSQEAFWIRNYCCTESDAFIFNEWNRNQADYRMKCLQPKDVCYSSQPGGTVATTLTSTNVPTKETTSIVTQGGADRGGKMTQTTPSTSSGTTGTVTYSESTCTSSAPQVVFLCTKPQHSQAHTLCSCKQAADTTTQTLSPYSNTPSNWIFRHSGTSPYHIKGPQSSILVPLFSSFFFKIRT